MEALRRVSDAAADAVRAHYEALGELLPRRVGDSLHFAAFGPGQDREEALAALEGRLIDDAGLGPDASVLDVGCGTGAVALALARRAGARVTGIDPVPRHVERARASATQVGLQDRTTFLEADATALPFPDASFDHVYAIESAYHAADKPRFYAECARVLRPGAGFSARTGCAASRRTTTRSSCGSEVQFAAPDLITLAALRRHLVACGLVPEVVADLPGLGDVGPNWAALDASAWPRLARAARDAPPGALRTFAAGARTLAEAAACGAFALGYWRASKPASPLTG